MIPAKRRAMADPKEKRMRPGGKGGGAKRKVFRRDYTDLFSCRSTIV